MGHCISVYLINKSQFRDIKIDKVLTGGKSDGIKWVELKEGICATTHIPNIREYGKDKTIAQISTDYFGGPGEQSAKLFVNNKKIYDKCDAYRYYNTQDWKVKPINDVLKQMGVVAKDSMDEFDTIGLGSYRSNRDFEK